MKGDYVKRLRRVVFEKGNEKVTFRAEMTIVQRGYGDIFCENRIWLRGPQWKRWKECLKGGYRIVGNNWRVSEEGWNHAILEAVY